MQLLQPSDREVGPEADLDVAPKSEPEPEQDFSTACHGCLWASCEGKTQKDCRLGILEAFRKADEQVVEAYNGEDEFFVVKNRTCPFKRPTAWADGLGDFEKIVKVTQEVAVKVHVFVEAGEEATLQDIQDTVAWLEEQSPLPVGLTVVLNSDKTTFGEVISALSTTMKGLVPWDVKLVVDRKPDGGRLEWNQAMDIGVGTGRQAQYYAFFIAGDVIPSTFLRELNEHLHEKMSKFSLLVSDPARLDLHERWVVQASLWPLVKGNARVEVLDEQGKGTGQELVRLDDKVVHVANQQGQQHMVKIIEEVCPCLG